jgi:septum formation protein
LFLVAEFAGRTGLRPLLLASTSRYRRELLQRLGLPFDCVAPGVDEVSLPAEAPADRAMRLARAKADAVARLHPAAVVIGSDQVAGSAGAVLDKPGNAARARGQLAHLAGGSAQFLTACAIRCVETGFAAEHLDVTDVQFRPLAAEEIERYVERDAPLDCAGSFKSESLGVALFERMRTSDPTALVGLPLIWVAGALRAAGYRVP